MSYNIGDTLYYVAFENGTHLVKTVEFAGFLGDSLISVVEADWSNTAPEDPGAFCINKTVHKSFVFDTRDKAIDYANSLAIQTVIKATNNYAARQNTAKQKYQKAHKEWLESQRLFGPFHVGEVVWFYWQPTDRIVSGRINGNYIANGYNVDFLRSVAGYKDIGHMYQFFDGGRGLFRTKEEAAEYAAQQLKKRLLEEQGD